MDTLAITTDFEDNDIATDCVAEVRGMRVVVGDTASTVLVRVLTD